LFFFSLGASFDLSLLGTILVPAIVMAWAMLALKPITYRLLLRKMSESKKTRLGCWQPLRSNQ
jgi:Kef-type K+ transport system membrane component KefB